MKNLSAASRITIGLVCSMVGILIFANYLGLLPDPNAEITHGRAQLTESLAFSTSVLLTNDDRPGIAMIFDSVLERQEELRGIGVRRADGVLVIGAGEHEKFWPTNMGEESSAQFMQVPLSTADNGVWGKLEVCYAPLDSGRWYAFAENPQLRLLAFVTVAGFVSFRVFLRMVLKNLDPSKAVPRRVREALDILNEGLMIVSLDDRILLANNAFASTSGKSADALVGRRASEMELRRTDGISIMPWTDCGTTARPVWGITMEFQGHDTHWKIFKVNCSPLFGNEGKIRGVMVSLDDVTQLEQNKLDLKIAKEEADAANKAKGDFLANMSHEIRNPMNAIVGFTDILRRGLEESESTRTSYLDTIHASGTHLVELINDILDFSKIEAGKLELEIRECCPYQIMTEVVNVLTMKAEQQSLKLAIQVREAIPETIQADPTRLRQILMNLAGNAIKFTAEGSVTLVASTLHLDGKSFIQFEIQDTGIGMTPEQLGRLFQEFMQADTSVTRRFGGTGLGLAISKRLTEAMGGQIAVESEPGVGSRFRFCVETGDLAGVRMLTETQARQRFSATSSRQNLGLKVWFKPARILITDDTPANRQLAGVVLRKAGLQVDEAENGEMAVQKATSNSYDLLLMDMQMPVMDGFTATRLLRDHGVNSPILAFTANVMEQDRQRCIEAGCTGFLTKPINIDLLLSTLAKYLPTQDVPPELQPPETASVKLTTLPEMMVTEVCTSASTGEFKPHAASQADALTRLDELDEMLGQIAADCTTSSACDRSKNVPTIQQRKVPQHRQPIYTSLPMEIPEFREIVESFTGSILNTMRHLRTAQENMDYQEIREIAHRIKGTGGTVGFAAFTEPSRRLQHAAEQQDDATIEEMLTELEGISNRVARNGASGLLN